MQQAKLKLIYIVTQAEWGGAQRYIFDLATALKDEFDIVVAAGTEGGQELFRKCQETGIRTHAFKNLVREINPLKDLAAISELAQFFKQEKLDVVHLNSSKAGIIGAWAHRNLQPTTYHRKAGSRSRDNLQPKLIYTAHGWVFNEPLSWWRKWLYKQLERLACKIHDKVIVLSKADFNTAVKNKICSSEKMTIIPHGIKQIDFFSREQAREKLTTTYNLSPQGGIPFAGQPTTLWIGMVANLYKTKGINYLVDAAAILRDQGLKPDFIVIGTGPERENYELRIKNYGLNNFFLLGTLENAAHYLKAFDIFVLPSVKEGMPYALLEAMQAGLPIVATGVGAIPEMINNEKSGLLVPPANPQALTEAIQKLLTNQALRQNLGQSTTAQFQEKFSFEKMLFKTRLLYNNNLNRFIS